MKSMGIEGSVVRLLAPGLVLLAACASGTTGAANAPAHEPPIQGEVARAMKQQIERLDHLEGLVSRFDLAVTHLERAQGEWGEEQTFDLNDIRSVAEELRLRSSASEEDAPTELQPRLDAMVERMKSISARYTVLQPKVDRFMASLNAAEGTP
jgi:hypothetical protein